MTLGADDTTPEILPVSGVERVVRLVTLAGAGVAAFMVLIVFSMVSYSVFMRYVLGTPVTFTDELNGFVVVAMVALGAGEVLLRGEHFGVDLLTAHASPRIQWLVDIWGMTGVILVASAILYSAVIMVRFSFDFEVYSDGYLGVQMWIPQGFLLIGMAILILAAVARIFTLLTVRRP
jgi:TRAP-type C4-dicarboxylate transport system permease small subunit